MDPAARIVGTATLDTGTRCELLASGAWRVTRPDGEGDPVAADALASYYAGWPTGPAEGAYGYTMLADLAARRGGTFAFNPPPPAPPGIEY